MVSYHNLSEEMQTFLGVAKTTEKAEEIVYCNADNIDLHLIYDVTRKEAIEQVMERIEVDHFGDRVIAEDRLHPHMKMEIMTTEIPNQKSPPIHIREEIVKERLATNVVESYVEDIDLPWKNDD